MAQRRSASARISAAQRSAVQAHNRWLREQQAQERAADRARAARARALVAEDKERRRLEMEACQAEIADLNEDVDLRLAALEELLLSCLGRDHTLDFDALKEPPGRPTWAHRNLEVTAPAPDQTAFMPPAPSGLGKLFKRGQHERDQVDGARKYQNAIAEHALYEQRRLVALQIARLEWERRRVAAEEVASVQHAEIDRFRAVLQAGVPDAVAAYFQMVLQGSPYPDGFPQACRAAYVPNSRQLVIEYELPTVTVVPAVKAYRYVKSTDTIEHTDRPIAQIRALYASLIAQTALRCVHEVFAADASGQLDTIVFNGIVNTIDPSNGRPIRPCLLTLRTTRDTFTEFDLGLVEPLACLKRLSAGVSRSPAELAPVRPVLAFDMVDPRFVEESDALSLLDQRPNLMELTPSEFESLIQNLFAAMGLDSKQTQASRDGGVDCVAYDPRPIFGGKVVIQAKRYRHTVGVSAVRDLFGTLQNEGASKGILVTTSGYGQASVNFANNKPIELIDGANLLYLLNEHAGIQARIEVPEEWRDPSPDSPYESAWPRERNSINH